MQEDHQVVPFEHGLIQMNHFYVDEIRLTHTLVEYHDFITQSASNKTDVVRLHFNLKGAYDFKYKQLGESYRLKAGQHNLMYSKGFDIQFSNQDLYLETFGIQFPVGTFVALTQDANEALKRYAATILNGKASILSTEWPFMDARLTSTIKETLTSKFSDGLQDLFLLSKCIEILVLQAEAITRLPDKNHRYLKTASDKDKIIAARDFVLANLQQPPNLKETAKAVGLNEYKLKRGFQELFNTTVFGFLSTQRLELAKQFLLDTNKTSSEIAYELGYSSPQHFNNAFKANFGLTPNSFRKK